MDQLFFTLIIPTYNRARWITSAVESVLSQSFNDYEIIIVDDGSSDNTAQIIKDRYFSMHKIRYFFHDNKERGYARNTGIKNSLGKYLVFLDSDDLLHQNHLQTLKDTIDKFPKLNFIATKNQLVHGENKVKSSLLKVKEGWYDVNFFLKGNPLGCHFCIRKNNSRLIYFNEDRKFAALEDWMFLIQNLINDRIFIIDKITITMNDHPERSMHNNQMLVQSRLLACEWILNTLFLSEKQKKVIQGYSFYFCALHSYLCSQRNKAINFLWKSLLINGVNLRGLLLLLRMGISIRKENNLLSYFILFIYTIEI